MTDAPEDARGLCAYLVRGLVDEPDAVEVVEQRRAGELVLVVRVAPADRGKVIGKGGRVVRSLRSVVRAAGVRTGDRVLVEVEDDGRADAPRSTEAGGDA